MHRDTPSERRVAGLARTHEATSFPPTRPIEREGQRLPPAFQDTWTPNDVDLARHSVTVE